MVKNEKKLNFTLYNNSVRPIAILRYYYYYYK